MRDPDIATGYQDADIEAAELAAAIVGLDIITPLHVELRTYDKRRLMAIAAGGGPRSEADHGVVYCRHCHCNKSGSAEEPNSRVEPCRDGHCACHDGIDEL